MRNVHRFEFTSDFQVGHQKHNLFLKLGFDFIINLKRKKKPNVLQKTQLRKWKTSANLGENISKTHSDKGLVSKTYNELLKQWENKQLR